MKGTMMRISYTEPLSSAWLRMNNLLFRPFDLAAWFGLGFTAFLAGLANGGYSGGGNTGNGFQENLDLDSVDGSLENMGKSLSDAFASLHIGALGLGLMALLGVLVLGLILVALYLSSRGRFMFLDNLVQKRSAVVQPWRDSGKLADSLFLWQIAYILATLVILGILAGFGALLFMPAILGESGWGLLVPLAILFGTVSFIVIVAATYVDFFLTGYVVPIMYRHQVGCLRAWGIFLALFREHPGSFVLSGLFYLLISMAFGLAVMAFGLVTCCIGLLLLAIPYIGSVLTLPVSVTTRYYTLDFLGQFGDDYRLLDPARHEPAPGGPGSGSGPEPEPEPEPDAPDDEAEPKLIEFDRDGTVIGPEDLGQDGGGDEPRP